MRECVSVIEKGSGSVGSSGPGRFAFRFGDWCLMLLLCRSAGKKVGLDPAGLGTAWFSAFAVGMITQRHFGH